MKSQASGCKIVIRNKEEFCYVNHLQLARYILKNQVFILGQNANYETIVLGWI